MFQVRDGAQLPEHDHVGQFIEAEYTDHVIGHNQASGDDIGHAEHRATTTNMMNALDSMTVDEPDLLVSDDHGVVLSTWNVTRSDRTAALTHVVRYHTTDDTTIIEIRIISGDSEERHPRSCRDRARRTKKARREDDVTDLNVVLGAGPVGRAVAERLAAAERPTRVVTRSGRADIPAGADVVAADIVDPVAAARACENADVVYGCVGPPGYTDWPELWPPMMEGMLRGAESAGAALIFMDNLYMYGPVDAPRSEDMELTDYGNKPATRAMITRMWQDAHTAGRVKVAAVRASDFYGPGVTLAALGQYSFGRLSQGKSAQVFGDPDQPHAFSYVPDVARTLVTVADAGDEALGQAWHVPNAPDQTVRQLLAAFAEHLGVELKIQAPPRWAMTLIGLFNPQVRELKEMLYQWDRPFQVDHSKFAARFWDGPTPFEEGIAATADWWRNR